MTAGSSEPRYANDEPQSGIAQRLDVRAHELGRERVREIDRRRHAGRDQIQRAEADAGIHIGLRETEAEQRRYAGREPGVQVCAGAASSNERLPEVVVRVHEAGHDDLAGRIHDGGAVLRQPLADRHDRVALEEKLGVGDEPELALPHTRVHRQNERRISNQRSSLVRARCWAEKGRGRNDDRDEQRETEPVR